MYFTPKLIEVCFARLKSRDGGSKRGIERTSALMYFLAFDSIRKEKKSISLNHTSVEGKSNRAALGVEYSKLITVTNLGVDRVLAAVDLGELKIIDSPEKRISSNFLTVPLKKASALTTPMPYPGRPAPLLRLGSVLLSGDSWGISLHENWEEHISIFLADRISQTPFLDFSIFVLRETEFEYKDNIIELICEMLEKRFSNELATYLKNKISFEKRRFTYTTEWFQDKKNRPFSSYSPKISEHCTNNNQLLLERIQYLESLLSQNEIPFT
jgi:hypothetical protein